MTKRTPTPDPPPVLDEHGFDPNDFEWLPVPRQPRVDGWSPQTQRRFIEALADTGSVTDAAREVRMSVVSCYRLRRAPGAEGFAAAWDAAIAEASRRLVDIAFDRAVNGGEEPVVNEDGQAIFMRRRYNDRLLMFLLRAHHPARYARVDRVREPDREEPPATLPVADAITRLEPVAPPQPHRLLPPEKLALHLPMDLVGPQAEPLSLDAAPAPARDETVSAQNGQSGRTPEKRSLA